MGMSEKFIFLYDGAKRYFFVATANTEKITMKITAYAEYLTIPPDMVSCMIMKTNVSVETIGITARQ
jgi:hypothetical protein